MKYCYDDNDKVIKVKFSSGIDSEHDDTWMICKECNESPLFEKHRITEKQESIKAEVVLRIKLKKLYDDEKNLKRRLRKILRKKSKEVEDKK